MSAHWTAPLAAAGLDPEEVRPKERLGDAAVAGLTRLTAQNPAAACWVPGRLELFGTHTDYAGGRTLVAALPRGFIFVGAPRRDGRVRVLDAALGEQTSVVAGDHTSPVKGWPRYAETVVRRLARNFPDAPIGADVSFASDLPAAAGMSSSSALMVGLAVTLVRLSGIRHSAAWRENIGDALDEAGYYACVENGRDFRALVGDAGVGTHGGSEDHAAMLCAEPGRFTALAFVPMRRLGTAPMPDDWICVVASSGVAAEKTGAARGAYNRLSDGAAVLLDLWNREATRPASLAAALATRSQAAEQLRDRIDASRVPGWDTGSLHRRFQHFVQEDARIPQVIEALHDRDAGRIGQLSAQSQSDSHTLLENQVEETVALAELAVQQGAFAARSFGAGFGGSVWALVERAERERFAGNWLAAYRDRYPAHRAIVFPAKPAPRLLELETQR